MRPTPRPIRWWDLLTLDHTVCVLCFKGVDGPQDHGVRLITDPAVTLLRSRPATKHVWVLKMRAALRRHIAEVHPGFVERVRWEKAR